MERIGIYKVLKGLSRFFIILGTIATILGISLIIKYFIKGFNFTFPSGDWNSIFLTIQGLLFIFMGYSNLKSKKYFIEWDDKILRYLLPDSKSVETIEFSQIRAVRIKLFEVEVTLDDKVRTINLENMQFEDIRKVKKKFEDISLACK